MNKQVCIFALLVLVPTAARAELIRIEFEGQVSAGGSFLDPTGLFAQGDSISGFWQFESTVVDSDPALTRGLYAQSSLTPAFQINIGSSVFETSTFDLQILNDHTIDIGIIDAYDVFSVQNASNIAGLQVNSMQFTIRETQPPLDALNSDSLFVAAPDLSAFDQAGQAQGQISGNLGGDEFFINLELSSATSSVPEPSAALFLGVCLVGVGFTRRLAMLR